MPDASTFWLFAAASLAFLVIPGPSGVYIVTRSLVQGRRAGLTSALGVQAGGLVHVVGAAIGVSALIASSATAFTIVKYAGAAYLVFLGLRKLLLSRSGAPAEPEEPAPTPAARLFWQGALVNVSTPRRRCSSSPSCRSSSTRPPGPSRRRCSFSARCSSRSR